MLIRLNDTIINLDFIKSISKITGFLDNGGYKAKPEHHEIEDDELERWEDISVNGSESQKEYSVLYGVKISYLNEEYPTIVLLGDNKENAERGINELAILLNNNESLIHTIKV